MKKKVIFIDDELASRTLYSMSLEEIYGDEYEIVATEPRANIADMLATLQAIGDVVSVVIDEKLHVATGADYKGSDLVHSIRGYDTKLPLYILTSEISTIDALFGDVEYVIDKNMISDAKYQSQCSSLMRRHIATFRDIQTDRASRFDLLLSKSLSEQLTPDEAAEYNELDLVRMKRIVSCEVMISPESLDQQEQLIREIEDRLSKIKMD